MKQKLLLEVFKLILIFTVISLTGCPRTTAPTPQPQIEDPKPGDFFPLTKGSTWKYQGEGNEFASFTRGVLFTAGSRAQIREDTGGTVGAAVFEIKENSVVRLFFQGEAYEDENFLEQQPNDNTIILQSPLQTGTTWETAQDTREIVDIDATVDTPAGIFADCIQIKITFQESGSILDEYYKEGVGLVKREFSTGEDKVTSSLENYSIE